MSDAVFREAAPSDRSGISLLLKEIMMHHGVRPPADEDLLSVIDGVLGSASHTFIVAEQAGRVMGMCALVFSLSTWSAAPVCEVQDMVVTATRRQEQLGRGLLDAAAQVASARGCVRLFLLAESWNLEAHAFYRRLGFDEKTALYFEKQLV